MVNAQEWLSENFPKNGKAKYAGNKGQERNDVEKLDISRNINRGRGIFAWNLEGHLDLRDFVNLKELDCSNNDLTSLDVSNCLNLIQVKANDNQLSEVSFPANNENLEILDLTDNNLPERDLSHFGKFVKLKELRVGNTNKRKMQKGIYNRLCISLDSLEELAQLEVLNVDNTNILKSWTKGKVAIKKAFEKRIAELEGTIEKYRELGKEDELIELKKESTELETKKASLESEELYSQNKNESETVFQIIQEKDDEDDTLSKEIRKGNLKAVETLLETNINVNKTDNDGLTPLHIAVANNHLKIVEKLLKKGADPNIKTSGNENTPLHFAAEANNLEMLELLVKNPHNKSLKGKINAVNKYGWTVLHSAASGIIDTREDWKIIKWLLEKGANTKIKAENVYDIKDVFLQKDYSYVVHYEELVNKSEAKHLQGGKN